MILSIGEILADLIGEEAQIVRMYCGGAPFNVAVNAKQAGAQVCFVGKAGRDVVGDFLENACGKFGLDECRILRDPVRNTTLAFVTLDRGERKFSFFRRDTADFHLNRKELRGVWERADLVHIGSLMLSERSGQVFAKSLVRRAKREGKTVSFDMNLREDLFADADAARRVIQTKLDYFNGSNPVPLYPDISKISELIPDPDGQSFFLAQACRSITLYKGGDFPYQPEPGERILLAGQTQFPEFFEEGLRRYPDAKRLQFNYSMGPNETDWMSNYIEELAAGYDTVIICVADSGSAAVASRLKYLGVKTIVISVLAPIPALPTAGWADTVLMAYSYSPYSFNAVFSALSGEFPVRGIFPLSD